MSVASQFFPSGTSGGGGGSTNIGGGTIPVEIVGMAGGGGGGGGCCQPACRQNGAGGGGHGGFFHAITYYLNPGTTYPITIGGGGSGGPASSTGSSGTFTSFNNPSCPIRVEGGGGGGSGISPYSPYACTTPNGLPGGSGGGAGTRGGSTGNIGEGLYFSKLTTSSTITHRVTGIVCGGPAPGNIALCTYENVITSNSEPNRCPWGCISGFPGAPAYSQCFGGPLTTCFICGGCGGTSITNYVLLCRFQAAPYGASFGSYASQYGASCVYSNITGSSVGYGVSIGRGGDGGTSSTGGTGCPGALVIKWASPIGAAPPTGFPGGIDISPSTPGFYTYCFTSSGSITLP